MSLVRDVDEMKIGDMVKYESDPAWSDQAYTGVGVIVAIAPDIHFLADAVSVLWASGELVERTNPHILEVISESR